MKETFEIAPEYNNSRIWYAAAAIYARKFDLAEGLFSSTTKAVVLSDERLVKAWYDVKRYDKAIEVLKFRFVEKPNDPQTHISLAAAYAANGNRAEAIAELQKAIELRPEFKEQGEHYIREIRAGRTP